ncbi:MAG: HIT family protein [Caulobacteraceae bacterium]
MSLDGVYDPANIFAKIARGEAPATKVFEDDQTVAFMDVFPQGPGHVLVIHKAAPARNLLDIEPDSLSALTRAVQRVARGVRAALRPDGLLISQFNGAAAGQSVDHLHFHVIPRWEGKALGRHGEGGMADTGELAALAERIALEIV